MAIVGENPHDTANVLDFTKNHGMLYGNVAVTFVAQMAFNFLVQVP